MIKFRFIRILVLALFFAGCGKDAEIIILCTNDMHGNIDNFPKLSAYYRKLKVENPNTFLFSDGDLFSGNPLVDQYIEKGYPIVDIMNKVGYSLSSIGNHEFDYGQETLNKRIGQAEFQFICANIKYGENSTLKPLEPYRVFNINGVTMSVLGLIEVGSGGIPATHPGNVTGLKFASPAKTAGEYLFLGNGGIFVLLSHTGVESDVKIAEKYPEIDVILGGHSHTKINNGMVKNGVLITQASSKLRYVGETRISVKKGKIVSKTNKLVDLNKLSEEDPEIRKLIDSYKSADKGNKVIGRAASKISGKKQLGALMTDALTEMLDLDIAFLNPGGIRIGVIPKGDITMNTVYALDPFGNDIVKIIMSYDELEKFLLKNQTFLVSGISCAITSKEKKKTVKITDRNGAMLDKSKKYAVGMNSYIYSTCKFAHEDEGTAMNVNTSDILIKYIETMHTVDYGNVPARITVKK
ncbi:MAG: bifunctional metallophosphatase/5'-nucleotidase [Prevotellaceae bacterium]|jgi:2',3'-cyclic-nucleotide 2'-phosphodiesterase (5'-nucleotidase family)|nr:bifunctional metallophosphatase/5'-nucleotidase [Prevotellaceae bacterium]